MTEVSDALLDELEALCATASRRPWTSMIEGRDHYSGDSFITIGAPGEREADMYVFRDAALASAVDLDLIAAARNSLPDLIAEVRRLRARR